LAETISGQIARRLAGYERLGREEKSRPRANRNHEQYVDEGNGKCHKVGRPTKPVLSVDPADEVHISLGEGSRPTEI
jgi:hypothetical protein